MPELQVAGDIFRLGAGGEFDGVWLSSGRIGAEVGVAFEGRAVLCHGVDAAVAIQAAAEIEAALTVFLPSVGAQGRAFAAAGAGVQVQVSPNVFEKVGLSVYARAFAQASLAGRIGIGLDFTEVARLAKARMPDLAYQIFIAFLNELTVEAGVWGRASFAAMAEARLEINGTVVGDEPGFQIAAGAGVGWGGGTAWDFFARIDLDDPRRFYGTAVELLTAELVRVARGELGEEHRVSIELLELILPIAAVTAYDLGEMAAEELLRPANDSVQPFLEAFAQRLAFYVLDKLVALGQDLVASALTDAVATLAAQPLEDSERARLSGHVDTLLDMAGDAGFNPDNVVEALGPLIDILEILQPSASDEWRQPIAVVWSAAVVARALRRSAARAGVTLSVLGISAEAGGTLLEVPRPPASVAAAYDAFFAPGPEAIDFGDVVDFLAGLGLEPLLERYLPEAADVLGQVGKTLDITMGDVIRDALTATVGADLVGTELYGRLRDFTKARVDGAIRGELLPALKPHLDRDMVSYVDEVVEPVLAASSVFVFDRVDQLAAGLGHERFDPFNQSFKAGLGELVWLTFARNVVFFADILLDRAIDSLHHGLSDLADEVRSDSGHRMADGAVMLASDTFGAVNPLRKDHAEAVRLLVADLAGAGAVAFGPAIWTTRRRRELKSLIRRLLEHGDSSLYTDPDRFEQIAEQFADCYFVPDLPAALAMTRALSDLTAREFEVANTLVIPALERFFLRITRRALADIERAANSFVAAVAKLVRQAWESLLTIRQEIEDTLAQLEELGGHAAEVLDDLADILGSAQWRNQVLGQLLLELMDAAEAHARAAPGFGLLPPAQRAGAVSAARAAADLAFSAVRPVLDLGLQAASDGLEGVADLVTSASAAPADALEAAEAVGAAAAAGVTSALAQAGAILPPDLTIEMVKQAVIDRVHDTSDVRQLLDDYIETAADRLSADRYLGQLRKDEADAQARHRKEQKVQASLVGVTSAIEIESPAPMVTSGKANWIYRKQVTVIAYLDGALPSYAQPDSPTRILVALNGQSVPTERKAWTYRADGKRLELRTTLSSMLRHGVNTLEISVVDTGRDVVRKAVSFLALPDVATRATRLEIVDNRHERADDRRAVGQPFVTIRNDGDQPVALADFQLLDRAGQRYRFAKRVLRPGAVIRVHLGRGTDSDSDVYWSGRPSAWDPIYLVDPKGILVAELAMRRRRVR